MIRASIAFVLLLVALASPAFGAEPVQLCPGIAPGSPYTACARFTCAVPTSDDDMVQTQVGGSKVWVKLGTVPPSGLLVKCTASPGATVEQCGARPALCGYTWLPRDRLGIVIAPPVVTLYPYTVTWIPPTANVDETPLTDLTGFRVENSGNTPEGPWTPLTVPKEATSAVFKLPSSIRQCFRVFALATRPSQPSDPWCHEPVPREPKSPTNVRASVGEQPVTP